MIGFDAVARSSEKGLELLPEGTTDYGLHDPAGMFHGMAS